jgi:hypothetical protein
MGFRILRDEVIHLNSIPFEGDAKKSASGTEIECNVLKAVTKYKRCLAKVNKAMD